MRSEVFVRGHSAGKSRTFPYEAHRIRSLWVMRDAPRQNPRDYRKEEWIAYDVDANKVDAVARSHSRGRFFVGAMVESGASDQPTRAAYRCLGYRLLATEEVSSCSGCGEIPKSRFHCRSNACEHPSWRRVWHRPHAHAPSCRAYSRLTPLSVSMWRWIGREIVGRVRSMDAVGGHLVLQTCTSTQTIGGAGSDRRCCAECCATIAPAARSVQC